VGDAGLDNNPLIPGMPISENGVDCNNTSPPVDYRSVALSSTHLGDSFSNTHTQLIYSDAASSVASYPSEEQKEPKKPHKHQQEEPEDCCCFFSRKKKKEEKLFAPRSREKYKKNTVAPR